MEARKFAEIEAENAELRKFRNQFDKVFDASYELAEDIVRHHITSGAVFGLTPDHKWKEHSKPLDVVADLAQAIAAAKAALMPDDLDIEDFRPMVAAIGVGIKADDKTMAGLMQAAKIGWEYGSGRKIRNKRLRLTGSGSRSDSYDLSPTDPHHGGKIWKRE
jgi:hypothetical protein